MLCALAKSLIPLNSSVSSLSRQIGLASSARELLKTDVVLVHSDDWAGADNETLLGLGRKCFRFTYQPAELITLLFIIF